MSELKCPFCQQELERVLQLAGVGGLVEEAYLLCSKCNIRGERKLWHAIIDNKNKLDDLSDKNGKLKSKLDIAVETIRDVKNDPDTSQETTDYLAYRLEQINQKEE